jgi:hypothetical protein
LILIIGGSFLIVLLLRHQGVVDRYLVEVWKFFIGDFLFDGNSFAFDPIYFRADKTACCGGVGFLAGVIVCWGQLSHKFEAVLAVVHGGTASGGGVAKRGRVASSLARARF